MSLDETQSMSSLRPSLAAIILGASRFKDRRLTSRNSFRLSATQMRTYLEFVGVPTASILNLFDSSDDAYAQLRRIELFCRENEDKSCCLLYYVGHGGFTDKRDYFLGLRATDSRYPAQTGLLSASLAVPMRAYFGMQKQAMVVLDCCFSGSAIDSFQSAQLASERAEEAFLARGTTLLVATSRDDAAIAPDPDQPTLFSHALVSVLREGVEGGPSLLTLKDVRDAVRRRLLQDYGPGAPLPEVHSPFQRDGDVADVGVFPNPKYKHGASVHQVFARESVSGKATSEKRDRFQIWLGRAFGNARIDRLRGTIAIALASAGVTVAISVVWPRVKIEEARLTYFSGAWHFERNRSMPWTGGACATSDVEETLKNDLTIQISGTFAKAAGGQDQHLFQGRVVRDGTPKHDCSYWQSGRPEYSFTSLRSAAIRCEYQHDCVLELQRRNCTGDCVEDDKQTTLQFVIPEGKRTTDSFVAVRVPADAPVINGDVSSYKFIQQ
jgi:hypothetical protein